MNDGPHALQRFVEAQQGVVGQALAELAAGAKQGHWMWFVFPQLRGLGRSAMSAHYGIASAAEARAYAAHPILGPRLRQAARAVLDGHARSGRGADGMLGAVDAMKLRSSMTLFEQVLPDEPVFGAVLDTLCGGQRDPATLVRLAPDAG